jgi:hypothetical protein
MQSYGSGWDKSPSGRSFAGGHLFYIILLWLERIQPRTQSVLSTILRVSNQLIALALPQDQDKTIPQNKRDTSHHQNNLMVVMKVPYTTWRYFRLVILLSFLLPSMCHENTQKWVSYCFPCEYIIFLIHIKFTIIIVRRI